MLIKIMPAFILSHSFHIVDSFHVTPCPRIKKKCGPSSISTVHGLHFITLCPHHALTVFSANCACLNYKPSVMQGHFSEKCLSSFSKGISSITLKDYTFHLLKTSSILDLVEVVNN
jgi:hypothetical protein